MTDPIAGNTDAPSITEALEHASLRTGCVREMLERNISSMECRQKAHDDYNQRVDAEHEKTVRRHPHVHSYYNNDKGRVVTDAPWRLLDCWEMTKSPDLGDFLLRDEAGATGPSSRRVEAG